MKFIRWFTFTSFTLLSLTSFAQQLSDKVFLTLGDEKITCGEFERIYLKNNQATAGVDTKTINEYLNLFINYKLKVLEAKNLKLDTSANFKNEYFGYRKQLALPYLTDPETEQQLINEAYDRMRYEISASHILIAIPENATPADTLRLYDKIITIRNRILNGEPFEVVARATSDDPSVRNNNGFLGYFTVFQMVYPFETAVYNSTPGSVSMPIRTRYGYHLIKVQDKRPAQGQVKVAHIMIAVPKDASLDQQEKAKQKIDSLYRLIKNNEDFATLAKNYSQDPGSAKMGGELPWFGTGRMIPEFEQKAFGLAHDGEVTEPFQSAFGWHIVKRLSRKEIGTFDEMLPEIKKRLSNDARSSFSRDKLISKLKKEYNFAEDTVSMKSLAGFMDSSIFKGNWAIPNIKNAKPVFSFANKSNSQADFARYIFNNQRKPLRGSFLSITRILYADWVKETLLNFEESRLEQKYPDFKYLMQEYYDGILLFDLTDKMVWSKATKDSAGINNFYKLHKQDYKWGERIHLVTYSFSDEKISSKLVKEITKRKPKNLKPEDIALKFKKGKEPLVTVEYRIANPDEDIVKDYKTWKNSISGVTTRDDKKVVKEILEVTSGDIKLLDDCRGQVISDYQQYLESEWLNELHQKYQVKVDQEVFGKLASSLQK